MAVVVDDKEWQEALTKAPELCVDYLHNTLKRTAIQGERYFRKNMPAGTTGMLRKSTTHTFHNKLEVSVGPTAKHAIFVENGTKPHWTSVKNLEKWANLRGINPYALQRGIAKHGTKAQPFLEDTAQQVETFAESELNKQMNAFVERVNN